jgi:hypothetical protein
VFSISVVSAAEEDFVFREDFRSLDGWLTHDVPVVDYCCIGPVYRDIVKDGWAYDNSAFKIHIDQDLDMFANTYRKFVFPALVKSVNINYRLKVSYTGTKCSGAASGVGVFSREVNPVEDLFLYWPHQWSGASGPSDGDVIGSGSVQLKNPSTEVTIVLYNLDDSNLCTYDGWWDYIEVVGIPINNPPTVDIIKPTPPEPQLAGANVTWACKASDFEGGLLKYQFRLRGPSTSNEWVTVRRLKYGRKWIWNSKPADIGKNDVMCYVRDSGGLESQKIYADYEILPNVANTPPNIDFLKPVPSEPQSAGTNITWSCLGDDTEGDLLRYLFRMRGPSTNYAWVTTRDFRKGRKWKWQTTLEDIGETDVECVVKDYPAGNKASKIYFNYQITK